jgi:DNA-binding NtrC family response regulator
LFQTFLQRSAAENNRAVPGVSEALLQALSSYSWPGNIRELEHEATDVPLPEATSRAEVVDHLEGSVAKAAQALADWGEQGLSAGWSLKREGRILFTLPRVAMVRSVMLNHWYHHRGELMVYFRLLDIPVPSVYGPSADEKPFG